MTTEGDAPRPRVILGLGNPGARYAATRHNVGFRVVEELARRFALRLEPGECNALMAEREELLLVAPQTYMNRSGYCARCLAERRELVPKDFLVVYDEVHLPLGALRLRGKGSPAGHRGMESVIENFGSAEVPRLRLGVAAGEVAGEDLVDFVLGDFLPEESSAVDEMVALAADACQLWAREGVGAAMQRYNRSAPPGESASAEAGESRG